jgi:hypothetical protein
MLNSYVDGIINIYICNEHNGMQKPKISIT